MGTLLVPFFIAAWELVMERVAVFVDAGYLYAEGSKAIFGGVRNRRDIRLDRKVLLQELRMAASSRSPQASLLRIYWYDGMPRQGLSNVQLDFARADYVKLRLGVVTKANRQKGVDSLMVTDIIELARNDAITDAVLMSGDEDVRIGVQLAQSFGVRVHLLGITTGGGNQSPLLLQEADTVVRWNKAKVRQFMTVADEGPVETVRPPDVDDINLESDIGSALDRVAAKAVQVWANRINPLSNPTKNDKIPRFFDAPLLAVASATIDRELSMAERNRLREAFKREVAALAEGRT